MPLALIYDENFVLVEAWCGDEGELRKVAEEKVRRGEARVAVIISCMDGRRAAVEFFGEGFSEWIQEELSTFLYRSVAEFVEGSGKAEEIELGRLLRDVLVKSTVDARKVCRGGSP